MTNIPPDISQQNNLEKKVERFTLALKGANDGIWDWDLNTNEVYYSPRWKGMLGYKENELENSLETWAKLVHPDEKERVLAQVKAYTNGESDSFEVEMRMLHRNGRSIHVLSRAFLVASKGDGEHDRLVGTHVDITLRKKAEKHNAQNTEILKKIAIGTPAAEIYDAIALMYEERHPGLRCSMLELHGNKLLHGGAPSLPKAYCDAVHGLEYGPDVGSCGTSSYTGNRVVVEDIDSDPKWVNIKHFALPHGMRSCWSEPIKSSTGKVLGAFGMYYNHVAKPNEEESADLEAAARLAGIVMERDQIQKKVHTLAYIDELTGLPSRAYFYQNLEKTIQESLDSNDTFGLLYIDLDNFKDVNDSLGHDVGDQLLQIIASRIKDASRAMDFVGRLGGDEFCILVKNLKENTTRTIAKRSIDKISEPLNLASRTINPTCSIGVVHFPDDGKDISSLFKAADVSMYRAKEKGKNQTTFYTPKLSRNAEYRFKLEQCLKEAIDKQQFNIVYQPQIDIASAKVTGFEALLRWRHPELGNVEPLDFIPAAEKIGKIKELTQWVLNEACKQCVSWQKEGFADLTMAVNISPNHLLDESIVDLVNTTIIETGITPSKLELEVIESVVQTHEKNLNIFKKLKLLGVKVAIDDFGSRYSYFASLKHLEVDILKIDKYFVDDICTDEKSYVLLKSMIEMGHNLGYEVTVEGVETQAQFDLIKGLDCTSAQGFLFSKPAQVNQLDQLLKQSA
ncbi:bifunctional diguanylate cyclase/phosphodiesterase [Marinicella rhabdoformis]|uniref:bifunctional diguanylate cyclase/phosphodiesterase n=1 Tax=Marinicella rhabdoformis TaxID=2580566 RepID=UPI001C554FD2|nr:EAL domain-containing protein [Marinicella rhabdoformis]